ncbi:DUF624 domain-containing protein [Bifidobacterium felsineum]|uniref:Beta-carotene 15,15'-monooxygenase n=1 Tax=Bifidobacterium felsineum TaxID=2045440 RepID=A0A2M9HIF3_9BIFI|nr:DUF624 domain-containing protein [Bifidobacterium felsineum]MBT1164866.1 DUF624 domain-containing protein [Bifidobacterium felsineum]PJM76592.1 beta-carotene 15,15'-monooxygenase [Bifidobacterium felsineum]
MNWLAPDSKFMRAWGNLVDGVLINLLMLITSIPVITMGAALAAGQDASRKALEGEGKGVAANYFKAFKSNFAKATLLWLPFLLVLIGLVYSWIVLQITPLLIPKFALSILWVIGFEWVFALQARFENTVIGTLKNAFIFGISHIVATLILVAIDAVFVALLAASWFYMPGGLFLLAVLGYGSMLMIHVPITERVFKPYLAA